MHPVGDGVSHCQHPWRSLLPHYQAGRKDQESVSLPASLVTFGTREAKTSLIIVEINKNLQKSQISPAMGRINSQILDRETSTITEF
jgi:hypothetical protein